MWERGGKPAGPVPLLRLQSPSLPSAVPGLGSHGTCGPLASSALSLGSHFLPTPAQSLLCTRGRWRGCGTPVGTDGNGSSGAFPSLDPVQPPSARALPGCWELASRGSCAARVSGPRVLPWLGNKALLLTRVAFACWGHEMLVFLNSCCEVLFRSVQRKREESIVPRAPRTFLGSQRENPNAVLER